jgi:hypothetical protein
MDRSALLFGKLFAAAQALFGLGMIYSLYTTMYFDKQPSFSERFLMTETESIIAIVFLFDGIFLFFDKRIGWSATVATWTTFTLACILHSFSDRGFDAILWLPLSLICAGIAAGIIRGSYRSKFNLGKADWVIAYGLTIALSLTLYFVRT